MSDSLIHAAAGAAGGSVAIALTYPLIFLSTRAAVDGKKSKKSNYQAILEVLKNEGLLGLYSGLGSSILGISVTNFVYYGFYEKSRDIILRSRPGKGLSTLESMLAGLVAGSATTVISNPIWVVQTSQAVQTMQASLQAGESSGPAGSPARPVKRMGIIQTVLYLLRKEGITAFFRGLGPALVLVINPIIQYTVFEQMKNRLIMRRTASLRAAGSAAAATLTDTDFFFLGALSKLVATASTYPYIVVKSRMQSGHKYRSAFDGLFRIIQEEGVAGLYKGIESKLVQSVLTAAILFAGQRRIYELTKSALTRVAVKA